MQGMYGLILNNWCILTCYEFRASLKQIYRGRRKDCVETRWGYKHKYINNIGRLHSFKLAATYTSTFSLNLN
jgi:hypothetical protein